MERKKISPYDLVAIFEERRRIQEGKKIRRVVVTEVAQDYFAVAKKEFTSMQKKGTWMRECFIEKSRGLSTICVTT